METVKAKFNNLTSNQELTLVYHLSKTFELDNPKITFEQFKEKFETEHIIYCPMLKNSLFEDYSYKGDVESFKKATEQKMLFNNHIFDMLRILFLYVMDWDEIRDKDSYLDETYEAIKIGFKYPLPIEKLESFLLIVEELYDNEEKMGLFVRTPLEVSS